MAIKERYQYVVELITDKANAQLGGFTSKIREAEGATGKMKAAGSQLGSTISANIGPALLTAGAAAVSFGAKSVLAFKDAAVEVGKFSAATSLSTEDASRWVEVANDVGVSTETMQGIFLKLNKAIGDGSPVLGQYGIEVQKTADGQVDMNATMLTAIARIGGIKDPTERAAAAQKVFGRSYAEAAEIVFDSADNVKRKLAEVADEKVFESEKVRDAQNMREALDNAKDAVEELQLQLGSKLAPAVTDNINLMIDLKESIEDVVATIPDGEEWLGGILRASAASTMADLGDEIKYVRGELDRLRGAQVDYAKAVDVGGAELKEQEEDLTNTASAADMVEASIDAARTRVERFGADGVENMGAVEDAADDTADAVDEVAEAWERMSDEISDREAFLDAEEAITELANTTGKSMRDIERDQLAARQGIIDYAEAIGEVPAGIQTRVEALVDAGKYAEALALLKELERARTTPFKVVYSSVVGPGGLGRNAEGTDNWRGGPTWVGERGPEIVNLPAGAQVTRAEDVGAAFAGSGGGALHLHFHTDGSPVVTQAGFDRMVQTALTRFVANGGRLKFGSR